MSRRSWGFVLAAVALGLTLAALLVTWHVVSLIYTASHPEVLTQFADPGVESVPRNLSLHAARQAWARVPWATLLWLLAVLTGAAALAIGGALRRVKEASPVLSA